MAAVKAGMAKALAGEALGRGRRAVRLDFDGHVEDESFRENIFAGRCGWKSYHEKGHPFFGGAELSDPLDIVTPCGEEVGDFRRRGIGRKTTNYHFKGAVFR